MSFRAGGACACTRMREAYLPTSLPDRMGARGGPCPPIWPIHSRARARQVRVWANLESSDFTFFQSPLALVFRGFFSRV